MSGGATVEVVSAGGRTPWKALLIGNKGEVVETRKVEGSEGFAGTVVSVAGLMAGEPIWFAADCLKRASQEDEEKAVS